MRGDLLDGGLAVGRGVADVLARRVLQIGEALAQDLDGRHRLVDAQRGLGEPRQFVGVVDLDGAGLLGGLHQDHVVGGLAHGALDLFMARMADEQDLHVAANETFGFGVHLGHQRARGVDGEEVPLGGLGVDRGGDAVCGEHGVGTFGNLVEFFDEDGAALFERLDHVFVVHDLLADVHRCAVPLEGLLDRHHGSIDTRAVSAGRRHDDALLPGLGGSRFGRFGQVQGRTGLLGSHGGQSTYPV